MLTFPHRIDANALKFATKALTPTIDFVKNHPKKTVLGLAAIAGGIWNLSQNKRPPVFFNWNFLCSGGCGLQNKKIRTQNTSSSSFHSAIDKKEKAPISLQAYLNEWNVAKNKEIAIKNLQLQYSISNVEKSYIENLYSFIANTFFAKGGKTKNIQNKHEVHAYKIENKNGFLTLEMTQSLCHQFDLFLIKWIPEKKSIPLARARHFSGQEAKKFLELAGPQVKKRIATHPSQEVFEVCAMAVPRDEEKRGAFNRIFFSNKSPV